MTDLFPHDTIDLIISGWTPNWLRDEMEAELNARDDYRSEVAAEHRESAATLAAESEANFQDWCVDRQDNTEARGGPKYDFANPAEDIPF